MAIDKSHILYLFERPTEPMYVPKGEKKVTFLLPREYYPLEYRDRAKYYIIDNIHDRNLGLRVKPITPPNIDLPKQLGRDESFSIFVPAHQKMSTDLITTFINTSSYEDLLSVALYCRDRLNPDLFIYALSIAILNHHDTKDVSLPPLMRSFPSKFVGGKVLAAATQEAYSFKANHRKAIKIPKDFTASDLDEEHRIAYWREDLGINLHHWHWHLVYPTVGSKNIVNKDRRGELFAYMHKQILARYNCERLCNQLERVTPFIHWREPVPEPYFPKLDMTVGGLKWASRPRGIIFRDARRTYKDFSLDIQEMQRWRERIYNAIHTGSVIDTNGNSVPLTEKDGIDVLGNMVEATILSINPRVYGNLHNMGHNLISVCHDPDYRYLEPYGVIGNPATAMRDPIFYRWHAFIEGIFQEYKYTLPPYDQQQLDFIDIEIEDISVTTKNESNVLNTCWTNSMVDVSGGLDFTPTGITSVIFTHLNHDEFTYNIVVNNHDCVQQTGTVRIFIAPHYDERGLCFKLIEKMNLMIEMDRFSVTLPPGKTTIERKSKDSSVTIPFEQTFPNLPDDKPPQDFCKCGWPDHMLVPKGTLKGFPMDLFIMISDFKDDVVPLDGITPCKAAASYCGLQDKKYPDARPMGYPFDRRPPDSVNSLEEFLTKNMKVTTITVEFTDNVPPSAV